MGTWDAIKLLTSTRFDATFYFEPKIVIFTSRQIFYLFILYQQHVFDLTTTNCDLKSVIYQHVTSANQSGYSNNKNGAPELCTWGHDIFIRLLDGGFNLSRS